MHILQCWMAVNSCVCSLQPWAFQAREFLRKKLIGKEICFTVENKTPQGREYGIVYLGRGEWCLFTKKSLTATVLIWNVCVYCSVVIVTLLISPKTPQEKISQSPWWPKGLPQFAEKASEETSKNPECPHPPPMSNHQCQYSSYTYCQSLHNAGYVFPFSWDHLYRHSGFIVKTHYLSCWGQCLLLMKLL